ncbi:hypothetical protein DPMN_099396 [Dreissena polymorpha]|uniref:Uncharacterized protein n=1 Tax=Dreissena polymorpha TaxID=45954 RepID=A0A9D4R6D8_DREPO|nr:hypothetical protein DPMN_099396 [Dreissena polymorpha]
MSGHHGHSTMGNAVLVATCDAVSCGQTSNTPSSTKTVKSSAHRQKTSIGASTSDDSMQSVTDSFRSRAFSKQSTKNIIASLRTTTKCEYQVYINRWFSFCGERMIDTMFVSINDVVEFLTIEFKKGLSYCSINTARAALSSLGITLGQFSA